MFMKYSLCSVIKCVTSYILQFVNMANCAHNAFSGEDEATTFLYAYSSVISYQEERLQYISPSENDSIGKFLQNNFALQL